MSSIRASKVRNVFHQPYKPDDCWWPVKPTIQAGDHTYLKANTKYIAVPTSSGGGAVAIFDQSKPGRVTSPNFLRGHAATCTDVAWHPFNQELLATGSADNTIKIWQIPAGDDPWDRKDFSLATLDGHDKRILFTEFHPTANNILAVADFNKVVAIWDIQRTEEPILRFDEMFPGLVQDLQWNSNGSLLGTSCKDKNVRLFDPRQAAVVTIFEKPHDGSKPIKVIFADHIGKVLTFAASKQGKREWKVWDPTKLNKPVAKGKVDNGSGSFLAFHDKGTNLIFLCGKGETLIKVWEIIPEAPWLQFCNEFRLPGDSPKGFCMAPKLAVDVMNCEVARLFRLTTKSVEPVRMIIPRRAKSFQVELYPDDYAGIAALTADEWAAGENKDPVLTSMDPKKRTVGGGGAGFVKAQTRGEVETELKETQAYTRLLKAEIASMEKQLADESPALDCPPGA